jgi:hypothetical protein
MKKFKINSILKFIFRPKHPENADESAIYLFSSQRLGEYWHYIKFVPCNRYGMFPVFGVFTQHEINEFDRKELMKKEEMLKKQFESLGIDPKSVNFLSPGVVSADINQENKEENNVFNLFGKKISKDQLN